MQKYTIAWEHSLRHAPLLVTGHTAIEAARHGYANDRHAFCVVFTCYKWALIKNRLFEQLFHLAFYTSISEYSSPISTVATATFTRLSYTHDKYGVLLKHSNKTHKIDRTRRLPYTVVMAYLLYNYETKCVVYTIL